MRGVNKVYYNMCVEAKTEDSNEIEMLNKIRLTKWSESLLMQTDNGSITVKRLQQLNNLTKLYKKQIVTTESEDTAIGRLRLVGKIDARAELRQLNEELMQDQVTECLSVMLNTVIF